MSGSGRMGTILVTVSLHEKYIEAIRRAAPDAEIYVTRDRLDLSEKIDRLLPTLEILFGRLPTAPELRAKILQAPALRWFQQLGAGANWLEDHPEVVQGPLILTNASGVHAIPISEHILSLMLCLARDLQRSLRAQVARRWDRSRSVRELDGSVMGLIGTGRIGEKTAEKAKGLNMRVLGVRRDATRSSPHVDEMFGPEDLSRVLSRSDWVVVTAPLTRETRGMIGERELRAMKPTACVINIGRGPIIQQDALVKALREGWIAGAGLDVFEEEPLPASSPLWSMENVVITAHYAGMSPRYLERLMEIFTENLRRYRSGEPLLNVVDKELGY